MKPKGSMYSSTISKDWRKRENRILGYVVLSPPIGTGVGEEGFWVVIKVDDSRGERLSGLGGSVVVVEGLVHLGTSRAENLRLAIVGVKNTLAVSYPLFP
jgi:hypothetical protein